MSIARRLHRWIWPQRGERVKAVFVYSVVSLLVGAAVLLSVLRLVLNAAPSLIPTVEQAVAQRLAVAVRISEMDAELDGLRPGLILRDVTVGGPGNGTVALEQLTLTIAVWESIQARALRLHGLEVRGLDVELRHQPETGWQVSGLLPRQGSVAPQSFLASLQGLPVDRLLLSDSRLLVQGKAPEQRLVFDPVALRWRRDQAGDWRFAVNALAGEQRIAGQLELSAGQTASARAYLNFADFAGRSIAPFLPLADSPLSPTAQLDGGVWLQLDEQGIQRVSLDLQGDALGVLDGELDQAQVIGRFERGADGWRGGLAPRSVRNAEDERVAIGPIALAHSQGPDAVWRLAASRLPLHWVNDFLPDTLKANGAMTGQVESITGVARDRDDWHVQGQLTDIRLGNERSGWELSDGVGRLALGPGQVHLAIDALTAAIDPPNRLRAPVALTAGQAVLSGWQAGDGEWRWRVRDGQAQWDGTPIRFHGRLWQTSERSPFVDVQADIGALSTDAVLAHLPIGNMHPKLVDWLDRAIIGGTVEASTLRLFGALDDFPFDQGKGLFDWRVQGRDIGLRYHPDWPALNGLDAALRFRNRSLQIEADRGVINGVPLQRAQAELDDLSDPRLVINGRFEGAVQRMQGYLQATPLLPGTSVIDTLVWDGQAGLDVEIVLPFGGRPMMVEGAVAFDGAGLTIDEGAIALTDIQGAIGFDRDGVQAQGVRAEYGGRAVVASASTQGEGPQARIRVDATTQRGLADWPGLVDLSAYGSGETTWRLRWARPGFAADPAGPQRIVVESDLTGLALNLPLSLSKPADTAQASQIAWRWQGSEPMVIRLGYGDLVQAQAERQNAGIQRLGVRFGAQPADLPEQAITAVTGALPVVKLNRLGNLSAKGSAPLPTTLPPLQMIDVDLDGVAVSRWQVGPTQVRGTPTESGWRFALDGGALGELRWNAEAQRFVIPLERLEAMPRQPSAEQSAQTPPPATQAPAPLPDIDLSAKMLNLAGNDLGRFDFAVLNDGTPQGRANVRIASPTLDLQGLIRREGDQGEQARLRFDVYTDDAGTLLTALGLPRAMRNGQGQTTGELQWVGPMLAPVLPTLQGELRVDFRNGSLPAIEPGAGRAFGLFSLSVLPRRLGLDFSDVVGEGLAFDQLKGDWQVQAGRLTTQNLELDGPSLDLLLTGSTDLVRQRYDQTVTVTPRVSSALTFFGGLAGGPAAALALFLTRDVLEPGVERLTEFEYRISGPWDDPRFELLTPISAGSGRDRDAESFDAD